MIANDEYSEGEYMKRLRKERRREGERDVGHSIIT